MTWDFWIAAFLISAICLFFMASTLLRKHRMPEGLSDASEAPNDASADASSKSHDLEVYKDQLKEIERDRHRGLLGDKEAQEATREIQRRILSLPANPKSRPQEGKKSGLLMTSLLVVALLPITAALYLFLGQPGAEDRPLASRGDELLAAQKAEQEEQRLLKLVQENPQDARAWYELARYQRMRGDFDQAVGALREAVELAPQNPVLHSALGEAVVGNNDGVVVPLAKQAFETALSLDPREPRARYFLALAASQEGNLELALSQWIELYQDSPAEAPWQPLVLTRIGESAEALGLSMEEIGIEPPASASRGPSREEVEEKAAELEGMTSEEQQAFLQSMVARLASRLEEEPENLEGWLQLTQAYAVLGERGKALDALIKARDLAQSLPEDDPIRQAIEEGIAELNR